MLQQSECGQQEVADSSESGHHHQPEEMVQNRVVFALNNIDVENVKKKSEELCTILKAQTIPWFVSHLINRHVVNGSLFLELFADVVEHLHMRFPETRPCVLSELLQAIKKILGSIPVGKINSVKKDHLKNLGRFLGLVTLARNKLVLDDDLNFKELLLEAAEMGPEALNYVVPFVVQVFKGCAGKALAPPCPYSTRVLKILKCLYENSQLDTWIKFEIEAFAENFKINLEDSVAETATTVAATASRPHIEKRHITYEGISPAGSTAAQDFKNAITLAPRSMPQQQQLPQQFHWIRFGNTLHYPLPVSFPQDQYPQFPCLSSPTYYQHPQYHQPYHQQLYQQQQQMQPQQRGLDDYLSLFPGQSPLIEIRDINVVHAAVNIPAIVAHLFGELTFTSSSIDRNMVKEAIDIIHSDTAGVSLMQIIDACIQNVIISETERVASTITTTVESHLRDLFSSQLDLQRVIQLSIQTMHYITCHFTTNMIVQLLQNTVPSCIAAELSKLGVKAVNARDIIANMVTRQITPYGLVFIQTAIMDQVSQKFTMKLRQQFSQRRSLGQGEQLPGDMGCQSAWSPLTNVDESIVPVSQRQQQQQMLGRATSDNAMPSRAGAQQSQFPFLSMTAPIATQVQQQQPLQTIPSQLHSSSSSMEYCCKSLASQICDNISNLTTLISADSPHSPVLRILQEFREIALQPASVDALATLAFYALFSFMTNYSLFEEEDDIKRIHLSIFKTLRQLGQQGSWIKDQVTQAWICSVEGESLLGMGVHASMSGMRTSALNLESFSGRKGVMSTWTWNWEAFVELLRHQLIHLHQIDDCLARKIEASHPQAVTFTLNLLDKFVLPALAGTPRDTGDVKLGQLGMNSTQVVQTALGSLFKVAHKREFTVLNEFDLWRSMRALERLQATTALLSNDFSLRLHLTCARIRALMDWGLFESEAVRRLVDKDTEEYRALFVGISRSKEIDEFEKTKGFVENACNWWWCRYKGRDSSRSNLESLIDQWLAYLSTSKIVKDNEDVVRFFRTAITLIIDEAIRNLKSLRSNEHEEGDSQRAKLDAFAGLLAICVKRSTGATGSKSKIILLNRILGMLGGKLMQLHEITSDDFEPIPFQRILMKLFTELYEIISAASGPDQKPDERVGTWSTLLEYIPIAFGSLLHLLRPSRMPKFQLAFLEIIRDGHFINRMLGGTEPDLISKELRMAYRGIYAQLLADLTSHVAFFFKNGVANALLTRLYSSVCDLWCSLFFEFPDFISEFAFYFSNFLTISTCLLRNLVTAAKPDNIRSTRSGSPSAPLGGRLDHLEDPIGYVMEAGNRLPPLLRADIDSYLATRLPIDFPYKLHLMLQRVDSVAALLVNPPPLLTSALSVMRSSKQMSTASKGDEAKCLIKLNNAATQANMSIFWAAVGSQTLSTYGLNTSVPYITEMLSDLVVYLCITGVKALRESKLSVETVANTPQIEILKSLLRNSDEGGQYLLISCMVKQLRYYNSHTCYFSHCLLHLFSITSETKLRELISRLLIEHLIINAPRSDGLSTTYSELINNPKYKFWAGECSGLNHYLPTIVSTLAEKFTPHDFFIPPTNRSDLSATADRILSSRRRSFGSSVYNTWSEVAKSATGVKTKK
ncbi:hypothetical protein Aperf_G00000121003 [Anoplocephala perfoliata]